MTRSATWFHSWVGFDADNFPILFASVDHHPTIADLDARDTVGCVRIVKVTDQTERSRLLDVHAGTR